MESGVRAMEAIHPFFWYEFYEIALYLYIESKVVKTEHNMKKDNNVDLF